MNATPKQIGLPLTLGQNEGQAIWTFGSLVIIKATGEDTNGGFALFEQLAPLGASTPLHIHHNEDEWFYITEGELTFWVDGKVIQATSGSFIYGPRNVPHTFQVSSPMARFLFGVTPAGFENYLRVLSEPAIAHTIPPTTVQVPSMDHVMTVAEQYGLEIIGPPGIPGRER